MPKIQIPEKLHPIITTTKRFVVLIGGRSSGKSESIARVLLMRAQTQQRDVLCVREFQSSIADSVHKLLSNLINTIPVPGYSITDKNIRCNGASFSFKGIARNPDAVKSYAGFSLSWAEEAQTLSQESIDLLLPTIRDKGSSLFFSANPFSASDPFSQRFIIPFQGALDRDGYYEDADHLIIVCNYSDNPWHNELESQRLFDKANLSRAKYEWIWEGKFYDSVSNPLIEPEWFDACVDAHVTLGFEPSGAIIASHDPANSGDDRAVIVRHGSVVVACEGNGVLRVNDACDWSLTIADEYKAHHYTWDSCGIGLGLTAQIAKHYKGTPTRVTACNFASRPDNPEALAAPVPGFSVRDSLKNKDMYKNLRAQRYSKLRSLVFNTYEAVVEGKYHDPDKMISFSRGMANLETLRTELCRMPIKPEPSGKFALYSKDEMRRLFHYNSPNLSDCVAMSLIDTTPVAAVVMPRPLGTMGSGGGYRGGKLL